MKRFAEQIRVVQNNCNAPASVPKVANCGEDESFIILEESIHIKDGWINISDWEKIDVHPGRKRLREWASVREP